jgi:ribulose kinase
MEEHLKDQAAAALGRKGGSKKVPKGFAMKTAEERTAAAKKGMLKRWGKKIVVEVELVYLPRQKKAIMEQARRLNPEYPPRDILDAMMDLISDAVDKANLAAIGINHIGGTGHEPETVELEKFVYDDLRGAK